MAGATSRSGKSLVSCSAFTNSRSETIKRLLAFPSDTNIVWKSHDDSIAQRSALEQVRQEKGTGTGGHSNRRRGDTLAEESGVEKSRP